MHDGGQNHEQDGDRVILTGAFDDTNCALPIPPRNVWLRIVHSDGYCLTLFTNFFDGFVLRTGGMTPAEDDATMMRQHNHQAFDLCNDVRRTFRPQHGVGTGCHLSGQAFRPSSRVVLPRVVVAKTPKALCAGMAMVRQESFRCPHGHAQDQVASRARGLSSLAYSPTCRAVLPVLAG